MGSSVRITVSVLGPVCMRLFTITRVYYLNRNLLLTPTMPAEILPRPRTLVSVRLLMPSKLCMIVAPLACLSVSTFQSRLPVSRVMPCPLTLVLCVLVQLVWRRWQLPDWQVTFLLVLLMPAHPE